MTPKLKLIGMIGVLLVALPAMMASASGKAVERSTAPVTTHPSQGPVTEVEGATARLLATDSAITTVLNTRQLDTGHPHTVWVVIINRPDLCEATPCDSADILERTDTVEANIAYGDGRVVHGRAAPFQARVPVGEIEGGWFDHELSNPRGAEVHLVVMDHGPLIPELRHEMTSTLRAGCTDESVPAAYPPVAFADGTPGPNTCRLVQAAIFQQ
ncbi:MAG: hypothetical protein ACOC9Y_09030 [Chloroflexota bacterium]